MPVGEGDVTLAFLAPPLLRRERRLSERRFELSDPQRQMWINSLAFSHGSSVAFLNGNNGEWTNTDDVKGKKYILNNLLGSKGSKVARKLAGRALNDVIAAQTGINVNKLAKGVTTYKAPVATGTMVKYSRPQTRTTGNTVVVTKREFIGLVTSSSAYSITNSYYVNPANKELFPWLSEQATQYEKYKFRRISFEFVASTPTTTPGQLMMIPVYDSKTRPPDSESMALQYEDSQSCNVFMNCSCALKPARLNRPLYIRNSIQAGDIRTSDVAEMFIAIAGTTDTGSRLGQLWIDYEVELISPIVMPLVPSCSNISVLELANNLSSFYAAPANGTTYVLALDTDNFVFTHDGLQLSKYINVNNGEWDLPRSTILYTFEAFLSNNTGAAGSTATVKCDVQFNVGTSVNWNTTGKAYFQQAATTASQSTTNSQTFRYSFVIADTGDSTAKYTWQVTPTVTGNGGSNNMFISRLRIYCQAV